MNAQDHYRRAIGLIAFETHVCLISPISAGCEIGHITVQSIGKQVRPAFFERRAVGAESKGIAVKRDAACVTPSVLEAAVAQRAVHVKLPAVLLGRGPAEDRIASL